MTLAEPTTSIYLALKAHLKTYTGLPFVAYPNDAFTPPTDVNGLADIYWIVSDMRFDVPRKYVDTGGADENQGEFQVHIMLPLRFNYEQELQSSGLVIAHFPKDTRLTIGGVDVQITATPKTIGGSYRDGAYNRLPVMVRWLASV